MRVSYPQVTAGQAIFLAKGERVRWVFTEEAEYIPVCLPAFSPANCFREEGGTPPAAHDAHTDIYHLVQKPLWEKCKARGETYYPPTYAEDGFTHATADPSKLLGVYVPRNGQIGLPYHATRLHGDFGGV